MLSLPVFGTLRATFDYKEFYIPGEGNYLEVHLSFDGGSLQWSPVDSLSQYATVSSTIIINQGEEIVDFRKNNVSSAVQDNGVIADFIDIQRFLLTPGDYEIEITLDDALATDDDPVVLRQPITIKLGAEAPGISSITLVEAYAKAKEPNELTKSGYDLLPLISDFIPEQADRIVFYSELYNANLAFPDEEKYLVSYSIWNEFGPMEDTRKYLRRDIAQVTPLLEAIDVSSLSSGNYDLVIEMRSKENDEIASSSIRFFKASAPKSILEARGTDYVDEPGMAFDNPDSLREYVHCLVPLVGAVRQNTIKNLRRSEADIQIYRNFFESFWMDYAPEQPLETWKKYVREVWTVNDLFTTPVLKGYESDRGRIWLKYGKPKTRIKRHHETEVFPYEIWHYYKIGQFNDKRFLFYSRAVVSYDFELLHSDMPGEIQNQDWLTTIRTKNNELRATDSQENSSNPRDTYSRDEVEDLFYNPR